MALTWLDDVSLDVSEYYDVCMTSDGVTRGKISR